MISVIITCHNERDYIKAAVDSVLAQSAIKLVNEILIVNDGSTDGSGQLLKTMARESDLIEVIECDGVGPSAARNRAIELAISPYIAFLDGDDIWAPNKLERQFAEISARDDIALVYGDVYEFFDPEMNDAQIVRVRQYDNRESKLLEEYFVKDGPIYPSSALIRHAALVDVGLFDETLWRSEETDLWLRMAEKYRFKYVPDAFFYKRIRAESLSADLEEWMPVFEELTRRYGERNERLRPLQNKRLSRRRDKVARHQVALGKRGAALMNTCRSIALDPTYKRPYFNLPFLLLPREMSAALLSSVKYVIHGRWRTDAKTTVADQAEPRIGRG